MYNQSPSEPTQGGHPPGSNKFPKQIPWLLTTFHSTTNCFFKHSSDENKGTITKDKMSWYLDKLSLLVP